MVIIVFIIGAILFSVGWFLMLHAGNNWCYKNRDADRLQLELSIFCFFVGLGMMISCNWM